MPKINVLDQSTINQIAAGEVIERPASVVKELLENAIDAKATAVTAEIREGGISFIRITDNGSGMAGEDVPLAFLSHATSKIRSADDLFTVMSLGFRGEALSSIAAVAQVELLTKTSDSLTGLRYQIDGGVEKGMEAIGVPDGTTFIVRNLFFNTPVRKKFLKTPQTEGAHIADLVEKIALSHPEVSIRLIQNNQTKLHTSGNHNTKDMIYTIFGREIAGNLLVADGVMNLIQVKGFIGKPVISRANRNYEHYFINGRYIRNPIIAKAIEEAYRPFMMQHKYPFTLLYLEMEPELFDINVHPSKMELRFKNGEQVYQAVLETLSKALAEKELIPQVSIGKEERTSKRLVRAELKPSIPEPFEKKRLAAMGMSPPERTDGRNPGYSYPGGTNRDFELPWDQEIPDRLAQDRIAETAAPYHAGQTGGPPPEMPNPENASGGLPESEPRRMTGYKTAAAADSVQQTAAAAAFGQAAGTAAGADSGLAGLSQDAGGPDTDSACGAGLAPEQLDLFDTKLLEPKARKQHKLIGQLFDTYWMVEYNEQLFIIDQHAAHEKVLYERTMASLQKKEFTSQMLEPSIILTLTPQEELQLKAHLPYFTDIGFEIEPFGGREYAVRGVPGNLFSIAKKELLIEMLDGLTEETAVHKPEILYARVASMSCKAAVKGNHRLSAREADALIDQLLDLENPYACPHGRPTIIAMTKYELEKKFKRIV